MNKELQKEADALKKKDVCINCKSHHFLCYGDGEFATEYCEEHDMVLDEERGMVSSRHTCDKFERASDEH